ncbi:MAG TPA: hypothetical protein VMU05_12275 [Dongiaceae bacterium]|nr:hypothetical protein [Dongiaceae bacterium]
MTAGRIACALSVFAVVCVLVLFFCPVLDGPYSAVHGPVTALLSIRAAVRLRCIIGAGVQAARSWFCRTLPVSFSLTSDLHFEVPSISASVGTLAVLRC